MRFAVFIINQSTENGVFTMRYIFLIGSLVFGLAGISQAMGLFSTKLSPPVADQVVMTFDALSIAYHPAPVFVRVLVLSVGFFLLFLIWQRLKGLGFSGITDYFPS